MLKVFFKQFVMTFAPGFCMFDKKIVVTDAHSSSQKSVKLLCSHTIYIHSCFTPLYTVIIAS